MKVLVVGSTGFIGQRLLPALIARGVEVSTLNRRPAAEPPADRQRLYTPGEWPEPDFLRAHDALIYLRWQGYALSSYPLSEGLRLNVLPALDLFSALAGPDAPHLIFLSSGGAVYGPPQRLPIDENHPAHPVNPYGAEKLAVENYLHLLGLQAGLPYSILRPGSVYGPGQQPGRGQGLIPTLLGSLLSGQPVDILGDGSARRDYLYIDDLVDAILRAVMQGPTGSIFNLGTGQGMSIQAVADLVGQVTGRPLHLNYRPDRSGNVSANILECSRAAAELGWRAQTPLETGIRATWDWLLAHHHSPA